MLLVTAQNFAAVREEGEHGQGGKDAFQQQQEASRGISAVVNQTSFLWNCFLERHYTDEDGDQIPACSANSSPESQIPQFSTNQEPFPTGHHILHRLVRVLVTAFSSFIKCGLSR